MKTKGWIALLIVVAVICGCLSIWLFRPTPADCVEVWSKGEKLQTLSLGEDTTLTVETESGKNVVTVKNGKVAVTEADCPDRYCVKRGWCSGGAQIVCLPNGLVLKFTGETTLDGVSG